ncbi:MAG: DUF6428 family protein [Rhodospirillales bacterium]
MNLSDLRNHLRNVRPEAALVFETHEGPIGGGYHVTEVRRADVTGIDCGANVASWTEATIQLLDGADDDHMKVGRFQGILAKSLEVLDGVAEAPLRVEFANRNHGLGIHRIVAIENRGEQVIATLGSDRAVCKPAQAAALPGKPACCTAAAEPAACCA